MLTTVTRWLKNLRFYFSAMFYPSERGHINVFLLMICVFRCSVALATGRHKSQVSKSNKTFMENWNVWFFINPQCWKDKRKCKSNIHYPIILALKAWATIHSELQRMTVKISNITCMLNVTLSACNSESVRRYQTGSSFFTVNFYRNINRMILMQGIRSTWKISVGCWCPPLVTCWIASVPVHFTP